MTPLLESIKYFESRTWLQQFPKLLQKATKTKIRSHVTLRMMIGYLLCITFEKHWPHDFHSKRSVVRTSETAVAIYSSALYAAWEIHAFKAKLSGPAVSLYFGEILFYCWHTVSSQSVANCFIISVKLFCWGRDFGL